MLSSKNVLLCSMHRQIGFSKIWRILSNNNPKEKIYYNKWPLCEDIDIIVRKYVSKFKTGLNPTLKIQSELDINDIKSLTLDFLENIFDIKNTLENSK